MRKSAFIQYFMNEILPIDVRKDDEKLSMSHKNGTNGHANLKTSTGLPVKPTNERWLAMRSEVDRDINDIGAWERFLKALEDLYQLQIEKGNIEHSLEAYIDTNYLTLLERFPLLTQTWKDYSIFKFQTQGIDASITVLASSVQNHPTSVDLWNEYLNALVTQDPDYKEVDKLRSVFDNATRVIGHHFNSDPIWDKIIEFEIRVSGPSSKQVASILSRLIHIPLYKYAIYFEQFSEINKSLKLSQVCSEEVINDYVQKFEKTSLSELNDSEVGQVIDDYCFKINSSVQETVGQFWEHESQITSPEFNGKNSVSEKEIWRAYLDFSISKFEHQPTPTIYNSCISIFDRALVPNCADSQFWLKYVSFLHTSDFQPEETKEKIVQLYHRANETFVPVNDTSTRVSYIYYLTSLNEYSISLENLLSMIEALAGPEKYIKAQYLIYVGVFLELLDGISDLDSKTICDQLIQNYFIEEGSRAILLDNKYAEHIQSFFNLLNEDSICIVVTSYLNQISENYAASESLNFLRDCFNKYYRQPALSKSTKFWHFFIVFEGTKMRDMINLKNIVYYINNYTQLAHTTIKAINDLVHDIASSNLPLVVKEGLQEDLLLSTKKNSFNSVVIDGLQQMRLTNNNYYIQDSDDRKDKANKNEELLVLLRKHANHPGVLLEAQPQITNAIAIEDINLSQAETPDLPTFRNVEKTNAPVKYPTD